MSSFALVNDATDPYDGDLKITNNSLTLTSGLEAIRQHLQVRFRTFFGEWFLDTSIGVPWFEEVLEKNSSFTVVQEILKGVVLDTLGVLELITFEFEYIASTRTLNLSFQCLANDGIIDFSLIEPIGD